MATKKSTPDSGARILGLTYQETLDAVGLSPENPRDEGRIEGIRLMFEKAAQLAGTDGGGSDGKADGGVSSSA